MTNKFVTLAILIFITLLYGSYKSYFIQRKDYAGNIEMRLGGACAALIQNDFGRHATPLETEDKNNNAVGIKTDFTIYNDILSMKLQGFSTLYFADNAPQRISCIAYLPYQPSLKISKETKIEFDIIMPLYNPPGYNGYLASHPSFTLTIDQIEKLTPLSSLFPLEKPKYDHFKYYKDRLNKWLWN